MNIYSVQTFTSFKSINIRVIRREGRVAHMREAVNSTYTVQEKCTHFCRQAGRQREREDLGASRNVLLKDILETYGL